MKSRAPNVFFIVLTLLMISCPNGTNHNSDPDPEPPPGEGSPPKYGTEFLGEWIRMDTGERWYISGNVIQVNGIISNSTVTLTQTAEQVITVKESGMPDYFLFASRVADASFNARVVFIDEDENVNANVSRMSRSLIGGNGQKPPVKVTNPQQPEQPPVIVHPDPDTGEITVPGQIPGDKIEITFDDLDWGDITVGLTPWDDQDMGIIPLARGENLKASIRMADASIDISELYADEYAHNYIIEIENIGTENCVGASYEISWDENDFSPSAGNMRGTLDTIVPGAKKQIPLTLGSKPITNEYKNKKIKVTIVNYNAITGTTARWEDTVSVNYYKGSVPFRFRSQKPVQGVIRTPRNRTHYFKTSGPTGNCTYSVDMPWLSAPYAIAFLGASVETQTETKYSLAIDDEPSADWDSLWGEDMFRYEAVNKSVNTAPTLELAGDKSFMYYLYTATIQYYRINLGVGVTLNKYGLSLSVGQNETLTATVYPQNTDVTWSSDNLDVATVDGNGTVSAVAPGTAKITAISVDGGKTAECAVTVFYAVTFAANGATRGTAPATMMSAGSAITLPDAGSLARTAYNFGGWNTNPAGTGTNYAARDSFTPTDHITLYAVWYSTVTFNANRATGGTVPPEMTANAGLGITLPGADSLTRTGFLFGGWNTSSYGTGTSYSDGDSYSPSGDITLYAIWQPVTLAAHLEWLQTNARGGVDYVIKIDANESIEPAVLTYPPVTNVRIILEGTGGECIIDLLSPGSIFLVSAGVTLTLGNNITLRGQDGNTRAVVHVGAGGNLIMNAGSRIIGNTNVTTASVGGVNVSGGTFTMNGGEISGNTGSWGGGVNVSGTFTMNDGTISGNSASSGGGVEVSGTFIMNGGTISGNSAGSSGGGGVYVGENKTFTMNDGTISGNSASLFGGGVLVYGTFRLTRGTIYGSGEAENIRNTAITGATLCMGSFPSGTAEYGTFTGSVWTRNDSLTTTNNTIRVIGGTLVTN